MHKRLAVSSSEAFHAKKIRKETPMSGEMNVNNVLPSTSYSITPDSLVGDVSVPELPVEVIDRIFSFLSPRERRNASLVSCKWHEAGNYLKYSSQEKLVFRRYQNVEILLLLLSGTKRECLNLEFHGCSFQNSSNLLKLSEKIQYLNFRNCSFTVSFKTALFIQCFNLKEFHSRNTAEGVVPYRDDLYDSIFTPQIFLSFFQTGFVNKNLQLLRLRISKLFTEENIKALLNVFPNIKHLKLQEVPGPFYSYSGDNFNIRSSCLIPQIIARKKTFETLEIFTHEPQLRLLSSHNFARLKNISLRFEIDDGINFNSSILDFIVRQECLEKISLKTVAIPNYGNFFLSHFILQLIQRCSLLKSLTLIVEPGSCFVELKYEILLALIYSNLISFKTNAKLQELRCDFYRAETELFAESHNSLENKTVQVLRIPNFFLDLRVQNLFIQCFKNLKVLELGCFYRTVMESIGQFQKNLTNLKLRLPYKFSNYNSSVFNQSSEWDLYPAIDCLRALTNLESLDLSLDDKTILFDCENVPPSVKYLRLSISTCSSFESEVLKQSLMPLKKVVGLEAIYFESKFDARITDLNLWCNICSTLKKLRLLCFYPQYVDESVMRDLKNSFSETHRNLFECCPSLRCLVLGANNSSQLFHYDQIDKKVILVERNMAIVEDDFIITKIIAGSKIKFYFPYGIRTITG